MSPTIAKAYFNLWFIQLDKTHSPYKSSGGIWPMQETAVNQIPNCFIPQVQQCGT